MSCGDSDVFADNNPQKYVSCIRINGVPVLPPILSLQCRQEMQYYKQLAKEVENRLTALKKNLSLGNSKQISEENITKEVSVDKSDNNPQESPSSHSDDPELVSNSEVELNSPKLIIDIEAKLNDTKSTLSSDVNDLPEHDTSDTGITKQDNSDTNDMVHPFGPKTLRRALSGSLDNLHQTHVKHQIAGNGPATLIRQKSYTVLDPSPELLAYGCYEPPRTDLTMSEPTNKTIHSGLGEGRKRRSWDLELAKHKWSSMATDLNKPKKTSSINVRAKVYKVENTAKYEKKPQPRLKRNITIIKTSETVKSTPNSKYETPVSYISPTSPRTNIAAHIQELYKQLKNQQAIQMALLIEKQKQEQMLLQQQFNEQNALLYNQLQLSLNDDIPPVSLSQVINLKTVKSTLKETNNYINNCDSILKLSRNLSSTIKNYSKTSPSRIKCIKSPRSSPRSKRRINYDSSSEKENDIIYTDRTNDTMADLNVTFSTDESDVYDCNPTVLKGFKQKSRNRSPNMKNVVTISQRKREAATKIVAHAKGYLTRRLLQTEKVKSTIQTIRDALMCALELHQDREGIRGADVDLHRRLIQQITAACYSLHDTVVSSTPSERCATIASDRARLRARLNKSASPSTMTPVSRSPDRVSRNSGHYAVPVHGPRDQSPKIINNFDAYNDKSPISRRTAIASQKVPWR